jgi:hypothetical protein
MLKFKNWNKQTAVKMLSFLHINEEELTKVFERIFPPKMERNNAP